MELPSTATQPSQLGGIVHVIIAQFLSGSRRHKSNLLGSSLSALGNTINFSPKDTFQYIEELSSPELKFHNEIKIILEYIEKYPLGKS